MNDAFLLVLAATTFALFIIWSILYFAVWRPRKRSEISGALQMILFRVLLPREENPPAGEAKKKEPKDIMASMEQFYAAFSSLRVPWFSRVRFGNPAVVFEMSVPHVGEEVIFYVSIPRLYAPFFSNQLHSYFSSAKIDEIEDYNLFHPTGVSIGAVARLTAHPVLSLRTYADLGEDPLAAITGAFAKIKTVGEGAAIQVIVRPAAKPIYQKAKHIAKKIRAGEPLREALGGFQVELARALSSSPSDPQKKLEATKPKTPDEELAKQVEQKASRPAFDVNIRLIASAATPEETIAIMNGLEAAFGQFANPQGNEIKFYSLGGRALEDLLYRFSFRLFSDNYRMYLSATELASIFHFPYAGFQQPNVLYLKARESSPPVNMPAEGLLLGESVFRGDRRAVHLTDDDRRRHLYIIGQTGTGKSVFLKEMARQDIQSGKGICFIDPHGDAVETLLGYIPKDRLEDVIYFNPGDIERPMGLNFLEYDPSHPEQKSLIVNELLDIFNKLYNMSVAGGPAFEQYFRNSATLVMEDPPSGNTLLEIVRIFADKEFRDYKLSRSSNIVVNTFWQKIAEKTTGEQSLANYGPYVTNKFDTFLANEIMRPIIAQEKSAFNFREVMDSGKILLVNLSKGRVGELNAHLLGLIIVGRILIASLSRVDIADESKRRDFYLYIDEFQNVTTKSIATILSEARKYRLNLTIAHQYLGQLEEEIKKAVFGNVGSMVAFRIGSDDGEFMEKQYSPVFQAKDLLNIDNANAYVKLLVHGQTQRAFNMKTFPPSKGDPAIHDAAVELSRLKYGRPRAEVEAEIRTRYHG